VEQIFDKAVFSLSRVAQNSNNKQRQIKFYFFRESKRESKPGNLK